MCLVLGLVRKSRKAEYEERGGSLGQVLGSTVKKGRVFPWILRRDWEAMEAMEAYKKWVRENKDYVHSLESLANVSSYLNFYKVHHFLCLWLSIHVNSSAYAVPFLLHWIVYAICVTGFSIWSENLTKTQSFIFPLRRITFSNYFVPLYSVWYGYVYCLFFFF